MEDRSIPLLNSLPIQAISLVYNSVADYALFTTDVLGTILNCNKEIQNIMGYESLEIIGKNYAMFFSAKDQAKHEPSNILLEAEKESKYSRYGDLLANNGKLFWSQIDVTALYSFTNQIVGFTIIIRDISQQRTLNEELEKIHFNFDDPAVDNLQKSLKELADYKLALDESSIVAITDNKGIITHVNDNFCKISKFSREELIGQDHRIINAGYHPKEFFRGFWSTIAHGNIWRGEIKNKAKDGSFYWVSATVIPFLNQKGKPYQYLAIRSDITEQKLQRELFHKAEANLQTIFLNTDMAFILLNEDFKVISFNKMADVIAAREFKKKLKEGDNAMLLLSKQNKKVLTNSLDRIIRGETVNFEINFRQINSQGTWFNMKWAAVHDKESNSIGFIVTFINITEGKLLEIERNRTTSDIIKRNKDLEQLTYIISHNLRAPVANIMGLVNLYNIDEVKNEDHYNLIKGIEFSVNRVDQIINDINQILEIKRVSENLEKVYFREIVKEISEGITQFAEIDGGTYKLDFSEVDMIISLRGYIHSIFYNLISNSIKYRLPDRPLLIKIRSHKLSNKIKLTFEDNGRGIDLKRNEQDLFGLYQRFDKSVEGRGMGLFMVKTEVEALGGNISLASKLNSGTIVKIELPV